MQEHFIRRQAIGCLEKLPIFLAPEVGQDKGLSASFMKKFHAQVQ